jgi:hypothetical protein
MNDNHETTEQFIPHINQDHFKMGIMEIRVHPPRPIQVMPERNRQLNQANQSKVGDLK